MGKEPILETTAIIDEKGNTLEKVNIVMLGNSLTYKGDWSTLLKRNDIFNGGKRGWTSEQLSWVIKHFVSPYKPRLCFFKAGTNDITLGVAPERVYKNMTLVMDSIKSTGTHPVYTTTLYQHGALDRNRIFDSINAQMELYCKTKGYDFLDLRPFLCKDGDIEKKYVEDGNTHLTSEAYPLWAKAMQPILEKYGL
ncbi:Lysophospholipase L1 [Croceitalea dokdonensis DOKDO 023]|uniref:Lysophospholipase L1 n=1 Tax=Croceitalea dokdonensis DOKDO 023 TaxID=1300341 RepID=A0A0N8H4L8_9FLAO|nr:GDSL-type esterase/lipase family protein [Croceitalea dokdonensis]KPM33732.1 Lysophospholipase L1 [Croceitalea dokdonensis DOKDO 023]